MSLNDQAIFELSHSEYLPLSRAIELLSDFISETHFFYLASTSKMHFLFRCIKLSGELRTETGNILPFIDFYNYGNLDHIKTIFFELRDCNIDIGKDYHTEREWNASICSKEELNRIQFEGFLSIPPYCINIAHKKVIFSGLLSLKPFDTAEFFFHLDFKESIFELLNEEIYIHPEELIYVLDEAPSIFSKLDDTAKDAEIARLKAEIEALKLQVQSAQGNEPIQGRTSQPQRDLMTLLVMNCYGERQSRNDLFNAINADLREKGIRTSEIKYSTLDKLIDEEIRINNKSPFPPKQK